MGYKKQIFIMTPEEITDYVFKWWNGRKTLDKNDKYHAERNRLDCGSIIVDVHTPWHTCHQSIIVFPHDRHVQWTHDEDMYAEYQWNQYHYSGILPTSSLTKEKLYKMLKKQQRVIEHQCQI